MAGLTGRPPPGRVADDVSWVLATWAAPATPLVTAVASLPLVWAAGERQVHAALALGLPAVLLALAGLGLTRLRGRRSRGLGYGLLAGGTMTAVGCAVGALAW